MATTTEDIVGKTSSTTDIVGKAEKTVYANVKYSVDGEQRTCKVPITQSEWTSLLQQQASSGTEITTITKNVNINGVVQRVSFPISNVQLQAAGVVGGFDSPVTTTTTSTIVPLITTTTTTINENIMSVSKSKIYFIKEGVVTELSPTGYQNSTIYDFLYKQSTVSSGALISYSSLLGITIATGPNNPTTKQFQVFMFDPTTKLTTSIEQTKGSSGYLSQYQGKIVTAEALTVEKGGSYYVITFIPKSTTEFNDLKSKTFIIVN